MALNFWFNYDIKEAIDTRRLHHQVSWTRISTSTKKRSILSLSLFFLFLMENQIHLINQDDFQFHKTQFFNLSLNNKQLITI